MRLPRESLMFLGLAVAMCALAGVVLGIASGKNAPIVPRATATATTNTVPASPANIVYIPTVTPTSLGVAVVSDATPSPAGAQKSLILIGVDDSSALEPRLEGVWVITFRPGINEYYVLGFPPSAMFQVDSLNGSWTLNDIFKEDLRQQLNYRFVRDAVQTRFPGFTIGTDVLLDRQDFAGLVSTVGGLNWAGQLLAGPDILASYDALPLNDNTSRMIFQEQLFQVLFAALGQKGLTPVTLVDYIEQLPAVQADTARVAALDDFIIGAPELPQSTPIWRTFQPEMEISAQQ